MNFRITTKNQYTAEISEETEGEVSIYRFLFSFGEKISPEEITLEWEEGARHYYSVYVPGFLGSSHLRPEWEPTAVKSGICTNMPFYALLGKDGECLLTLSLSDVIHPAELSFGYVEETDCVKGKVKLFTSFCSPMKSYALSLRIDRESGDLAAACKRVVAWWEEAGYVNTFIPDAAFEPVYSTWYNFHQNLCAEKLLKECRIAAGLGIKTLIVDDGWQTDDTNRGYGYCGDWAVAASKFYDFKAFVAGVHALGMKVMVWFSVPYMGDYAKAYERFRNKILLHDEFMHTNVLDPRYKKVREYLVGIYADFLQVYDVDGLKLDFIDAFKSEQPFFYREGMDCYSVEEGVLRLLSDIREAITSLKKDALIEFRQPYCGPVIGAYANMLRVADCPGDTLANLNESVRLRLLSGHIAVHSDMLTCHTGETPEAIAAQLISALFSVPQISFTLSELSEKQLKVLKFYLDFHARHRKLLLKSKLKVYRTDKGIVKAEGYDAEEKIVALYAEGIVRTDGEKRVYIVNGSGQSGTVVRSKADYRYFGYDCCGELVKEGTLQAGRAEYIETENCFLFELRKSE